MDNFTGYMDYGIMGMTILVLLYAVSTLWKYLRELNGSYRKDISDFSTKHDNLVKEMDKRQGERDGRQDVRDEKLNDVLRDLSFEIGKNKN